jgi:hypothetical protein
VLAGLVGLLTDEVKGSSAESATRITLFDSGGTPVKTVDITQPDPPRSIEALREVRHTGTREVIDDLGDFLLRPFSWIAEGSQAWVQRLLYSGLALLLYGLVLQIAADRLRVMSDLERRREIAAAEQAAAAKRRATGSFASPA